MLTDASTQAACSKCGLVKSKESKLCARATWPTVPAPPPFQETPNLRAYKAAVRAEKTAREAAPRVPVCVATERRCRECADGCRFCCKWECDACASDTETARRFEEYHEDVDPDVAEDEYGRKVASPYSALALSDCVTCGKSVCHSCSTNCARCTKAVCRRCPKRHTWCEQCRQAIDNGDDADIGPIDRKEGVCGACWRRGGTRCGCGQRAYDSDMEDDEGDEEDSDDGLVLF